MGPLDVFLRVSFAGFAAILATVSVQSYTRHRERRFLLLTAAFGIFLAQGLWLLIEMATVAVSSVGSGWLALNLAVLISLYLALLRLFECRKALNWKAVAGSTISWLRTRARICGGSDMHSGCRPACCRTTSVTSSATAC